MKNLLLLFPLLGMALSSCGIQDTMNSMEWNRQAIDRSTAAIQANRQAIEEANRSIAENQRQLDQINQTLKKASEQ
jgi:hypothetical protein